MDIMGVYRCKECGIETAADASPKKCACGAKNSFSQVDTIRDFKCAHCRGCHH